MSWLSDLFRTSGALDARGYLRALTPIGIVSPILAIGLGAASVVLSAAVPVAIAVTTWIVLVLALITPASIRRARDIGWPVALP